jgi:hypothetical protein
MNIYKILEDSLYNAFISQFPDARITFPFSNAPEPQTPFIVLEVVSIDAVGMAHTGGYTDNGITTIMQDYEVELQLEVIGGYDNQTEVGDLAHKIEFSLRTPLFLQALRSNNLSLMRYRPVTRFPRKRDTKTYMCYQQDVYLAYSIVETQDVGYIGQLTLEGVYQDAGREGHTIETLIEII